MLGGNEALAESFLDAAHARGMKVVLDGVFNHASRGFFQFHDILENGLAERVSGLVSRPFISALTPTTTLNIIRAILGLFGLVESARFTQI